MVAMLTFGDGCFKRASLGGWNRWLEQHKEGEATEQRSKGARDCPSIRHVQIEAAIHVVMKINAGGTGG